MIVPPKPYTKEKLGGYLLNDEQFTDNIFIEKYNNKGSTVGDDNILSVINNISTIGYKINKDVLNFIKLHGLELGLISSDKDILELKLKKKLTKLDRKHIDSLQSKFDLDNNILGIAEVYQNLPSFYIPVRMDSRGRIYCISNYLNYQSSDLAKSLLLFSKGEIICKTNKRAFQ
jgi:DNA-directed RNA polymerase